MATPALEITNLHAWYGESHILHGINLSVQPGQVVTLLGRNGAGRTTTLRAILGLTGARKGSIKIHGEEAIHLSTHRIANLGIGYCPEERGIFASLTTEENLRLPPPLKSKRGKVMSEQAPARACPAANSRCWPSPASCAPAPTSCCSTRSPKASPPSSSRPSPA
jgi:branched-chain amino acid transport system ATP-binding protein